MSDAVRRAGDDLNRALGRLEDADDQSQSDTSSAADRVDYAARRMLSVVSDRESVRELNRVLSANDAIKKANRRAFFDMGFVSGKYVRAKADALAFMRRVARDAVNRERAL